MIRLLFEIKKGEVWGFDTHEFYIDSNGRYCFIDLKTGRKLEYHESMYRGKEVF